MSPQPVTSARALFLFFVLLLLQTAVIAQPVYTLTSKASAAIQHIAVLPDRNYSFQQITTNSQLPFTTNDSLQPGKANSYWLKIIVANPFPQAISCNLEVQPNLDNTLYYFDANAGNWVAKQAGILSAGGNRRLNTSIMPCILRAHAINTIYVKAYINTGKQPGSAFVPTITIQKEAIANNQERLLWITWITSLTVLFLFVLNNAYIWFSFKDKAVLYFLIAQLGGLIYITAYKQVFPVLFPNTIFTTSIQHGLLYWYNVNSLLLHSSILVLMYGLVHFTCSYLNSRRHFPRLHYWLRYTLNTWLLMSFIFTIVNAMVYIENYTWIFDNIFTLFFTAAVMYMSIMGYVRKLPATRPFLLANMLSFAFMLGTSLYHLIVDLSSAYYDLIRSLLPDLAIITQTIGFSVALVARTRLLQSNLADKEMEVRQLEFDLREMELRHQLISQENQTIGTEMQHQKTRNEQLQEKLEANQRELASITLYMAQKNELLAKLKTQITDVKKHSPGNKQEELNNIESLLKSNLHLDDDWTKFKLHFEQVHPDFFEELKVKHPNLTKNEIRLCAYFHLNLSTKEIAALLNIDPASVRRAKTRLYKKMGIGNVTQPAGENEEED